VKSEHLIDIEHLETGEIEKILMIAGRLKEKPILAENVLRGKAFGLIFEKPSTRTWVSFEVGITSMGGRTTYLGPQDIKLDVREATKDVARVLGRYWDGAILRTFKHETVEEFASYFKKPVINGLTDKAHPCQALADFLTLKENFKTLKGLTLAYIGDGNNVLNSLLFLAAKVGTNVNYSSPKGYEPDEKLLEKVRKIAKTKGAKIQGFATPQEAVKDAQAIYTDVWVSMGEEKIAAEKRKSFKGYQINSDLLKLADRDAIVLHCLPAHRGEEITDEVMESRASRIFDQAENRLHAQKAVLARLFGKF